MFSFRFPAHLIDLSFKHASKKASCSLFVKLLPVLQKVSMNHEKICIIKKTSVYLCIAWRKAMA
jgi:hypothetical protein